MEFIVVISALWLSPAVYAWIRKHEKRKLIYWLTIGLGPLGALLSLIILTPGSPTSPKMGDPGVFLCPHCGEPYHLEAYRPESSMTCAACKERMSRPGNRLI